MFDKLDALVSRFEELEARLSASQEAEAVRSFPPLSLDFQRQRATIRDVDLTLTQSEFSLLTLIWQIRKAARTNPAKAIKTE